ncbi:MAG: ABC transporter permease [Candidatus Thermoplasmatota archaeon]|nr:ABC transporter permease [Candidatus Thermoplasmatota archaeon]
MSVKRSIAHSFWIAHKDLLEFSRNRVLLVMLFVFPLFMMLMTGYIFPSGESIKDMPVVIVNEDIVEGGESPESIQFIENLTLFNDHTGYFTFSRTGSYDEARDQITRGEKFGAVIINSNFTDHILSGKQGGVTVLYDQSKPQISSQLTAVLGSVISQMGTTKAIATVSNATGMDNNASRAMVTPYKIDNKGTVPGDPSYFQFLAPGMMMMVVMFSVMLGLPRAISHEKEAGTFDGILAAPTSRFSIILGKTLAQGSRGLIQGGVVLLLALVLFGVVVQGSFLLVILLLILGIFSFIGMGIVITSVARDEETAQTLMMILQFPMMFLSGVFFPIEQMPWYMQYLSKVTPLTYAIQALRKVVVLGAGIEDITTEIIILLAFGVITLGIAIPLFRKAMSR